MSKPTYTQEQAMEAALDYFGGNELAATAWVTKYALRTKDRQLLEVTPTDMHRRMAKEFARIEANYPNPLTEEEIFKYFDKFTQLIPQGSPMAGIGNTEQLMSLGNCFVVDSPHDSIGGIMNTDQQLAQLMKRRAGVGVDISTIRPKGMAVGNAAGTTDGIGVFMERFSNTCREVSQCLDGTTKILTKTDGLKPISSIVAGDLVWTSAGWVPVLNVLQNKKPTVKLTTVHGKEIICSEDHVFHTINGELPVKLMSVGDPITQIVSEEGWDGKLVNLQSSEYKPTKRLSKHDKRQLLSLLERGTSKAYIADRLNVNLSTVWRYASGGNNHSDRLSIADAVFPTTLTNKLAYCLGLMYGDGHVDSTESISVAMSDDWPEIMTKFNTYILEEFNCKPQINKHNGERCTNIRINSKQIVEFLRKNRLLKQLSDKLVFPEQFFASDKKLTFAFISGFFDANGTVGGKKKNMKMSSVSKGFLLDIQQCLSSFGVVSKLHKQVRNKPNWKPLFSLTVNGAKSQKLFASLMTESVKVKSASLTKERDFTRTIYTVKDFGTIASKHSFVCRNDQFVSYTAADRLQDDLNPNASPKPIRLLQDFVASITPTNTESVVYDLVLPTEHLFYANGLYAHNSGRRGALLLSISCHHPEVLTFIKVKRDLKKVTGANISVRVTDEFMSAVKSNGKVELRWPVDNKVNPVVREVVDAKPIWDELITSAWQSAEPGVLFWDTITAHSPSDCYKQHGFETLSTNPCGEITLSGWDSCRLLLVNSMGYVNQQTRTFDVEAFKKAVEVGQRLMDDLVDLELEAVDKIIAKVKAGTTESQSAEESCLVEQKLWERVRTACLNGRRTGLGLTAVGDLMAFLGIRYGSKESVDFTDELYKAMAVASFKSTVRLAKERGAFPVFDYSLEKDSEHLQRIASVSDAETQDLYKKHGRRNISCTTTPPAGTTSLMAWAGTDKNGRDLFGTTSGIEPAYLISYKRRKKINPSEAATVNPDFVDPLGDKWVEFDVVHSGFLRWKDQEGSATVGTIEESPYHKATSADVDWKTSVDIQAAAQKWVSHSISKTCNLPSEATKELVSEVYMRAYDTGCKGFTIYRDGSRTGVLVSNDSAQDAKLGSSTASTTVPKRPKELECDVYNTTVQGERWVIFVGKLPKTNQPYEIMGGLARFVKIPKRVKVGKIVKHNGPMTNPARYDFHFDYEANQDDEMIIQDIGNIFENVTHAGYTRMLSLSLRHGVPVQFVVEQLQKGGDKEDSNLFSISKVLGRVLKNYIVDGTKVSGSSKCCSECKSSRLAYKDGCVQCLDCLYSKCG